MNCRFCQIYSSGGGKFQKPEENPSKFLDGEVVKNNIGVYEIYLTRYPCCCELKLRWIYELYSGGYL